MFRMYEAASKGRRGGGGGGKGRVVRLIDEYKGNQCHRKNLRAIKMQMERKTDKDWVLCWKIAMVKLPYHCRGRRWVEKGHTAKAGDLWGEVKSDSNVTMHKGGHIDKCDLFAPFLEHQRKTCTFTSWYLFDTPLFFFHLWWSYSTDYSCILSSSNNYKKKHTTIAWLTYLSFFLSL